MVKKCCDHKDFCKHKREAYIQVAYETASAYFEPSLNNNVLTETHGMALRRDPKGKEKNDYGKNDEYKNREKHIYKENRTDGLCCSLSFQ